jgi:hypothetical protein
MLTLRDPPVCQDAKVCDKCAACYLVSCAIAPACVGIITKSHAEVQCKMARGKSEIPGTGKKMQARGALLLAISLLISRSAHALTCDEGEATPISRIQGTSHLSPLRGENVVAQGIVTRVNAGGSNNFMYIQV